MSNVPLIPSLAPDQYARRVAASRAVVPLVPVVVEHTEHAPVCSCPACPQIWPHRANDGAPVLVTVRRVHYARPGAGPALTARAIARGPQS